MKKQATVAAVALAITAGGRLFQPILLNRVNTGLNFGNVLLMIILLVAICAGVLALFAYLFATFEQDQSGFLPIWKRLGKVFLLFFAAGIVLALLLGLVAALLGRWLPIDSARRAIDWISVGLVALLLPVGLHVFFRAGLYNDSFRKSFDTLKPMYLWILGVGIAVVGFGRLLGLASLPGWAVTITSFVLLFCALFALLHIYQRQSKPKKVYAEKGAAQ